VPTISQNAIDIEWYVTLASATTYADKQSALVAATALSAANSNSLTQIGEVQETVTAPSFPLLARVDMPSLGYVVQLISFTTYYPLEQARVAAYALSAANANAPVFVSKIIEQVTAP